MKTSLPQKKSKYLLIDTKQRILYGIALFFAVVLIVSGSFGVRVWWQKTHERTSAVSDTFDLDEPSEVLITLADKPPFDYAPDQPKTIQLPSIGAAGYIQKVGLRKDSSVGVSSNISIAGWYTKSVRPGEKGLSIIDGHVRGNYNPGIFEHLGDLKPGDNLTIAFGDDSVRDFVVVRVKSYPFAEAGAALFNKDPEIDSQLNLMTCGGEFDTDKNGYPDRVLVVAKALNKNVHPQ